MMQEAYNQVREVYLQAGFEVADERVMLDHIWVELNFMAVLLRKSIEGNTGTKQYSKLSRQFAQEHLAPWVPLFAKDLEQATELSFYRAIAYITMDLITQGQ